MVRERRAPRAALENHEWRVFLDVRVRETNHGEYANTRVEFCMYPNVTSQCNTQYSAYTRKLLTAPQY